MSRRVKLRRSCAGLFVLSLAVIAMRLVWAGPGSVASAARIAAYLMASETREIALARSAAPHSVSARATVMVLSSGGYVIAAKGVNSFVCLVARSWDYPPEAHSALFWDPKFRAPDCYNAAAQRSVLRLYLMKTRWVLAGASRHEISDREKTAWAKGRIEEPLPGAMSYMMSRRGRGIGGEPGPWRPHLMFYFPRALMPHWGANLPGNPVFAQAGHHIAVFVVLVPVWSGGAPAPSYH
jgi:hypothetical protein